MKTRTLVAALLVVLVVACSPAGAEPDDPHVERPTAGASETVAFAAAWDEAAAQAAWFEGVNREMWVRGVEEAQAMERARRSPVSTPVGGRTGECAALSAQLGLPEAVLWRESRCQWGAVNVTGCSGRGCVGPAQVDTGHFAEVSPWNPNAQGVCYGLNSGDEVEYAQCVERLPASAWG